jgi:hypothetical protein
MHTDFKIKDYYSRNAWDYDRALPRAISVLKSFDSSLIPKDITSVLELYNIHLLLNGVAKQSHLEKFTGNEYPHLSKIIMQIVGSFYSQITKENIVPYANDCYVYFRDDFWDLIVKFKVYKRLDKFPWIAKQCSLPLYKLLKYKEVVKELDDELSDFMRLSDQTGQLLIDYYLRRHKTDEKLYFPDGFTKQDKKNAVNAYIQQEHANPNVLTLIIESPKNMEKFPIDDRMRRDARHRMERIFEDKSLVSISRGIQVGAAFEKNIPEIVRINFSGDKYEAKYSVDWLEDNRDYPTLLNNFIYLFEYVDYSMRCQFVEKNASRGAVEDSFLVKGVKSYINGHSFKISNMMSSAQMGVYYQVLSDLNISLEDVIKWFFEVYLREEFMVEGFVCNMSKGTDNYLTKCKMIVSAMDGVAKQYRMYLEDGIIDRELYEQSSEHMRYELLESFQKCKYIYCVDPELLSAQHALFSDQSMLYYIEKTKEKYNSLIKLITNEAISLEDFYEYQIESIKKLINLKVIEVKDDILMPNIEACGLLHEFYYQEVVCFNYRNSKMLKQWLEEKKVSVENTLFSKNEADYINYMLNQSEFSNGYDLRNKYSHDTCPLDKRKQQSDYIELLKIMILMVIKINEEFYLKK